MEFRKMVTMTLYVRQQKRHRCKEQTFGLCGRKLGWDDLIDSIVPGASVRHSAHDKGHEEGGSAYAKA